MDLQDPVPLADVRTPAEFEHGHIPGAFNLPLFSNDERVRVGTAYKQQSKEAAILLGFELTGPKWAGFIRKALEIAPGKQVAIHCWRGGMRSGAMAWALDLYGFQVYLIDGGYKRYRRWVLDQLEKDWPLTVVGGMTGSGKTRILHELRRAGEQVIDLEDLAQHCGSSYGTLNRLIQPTQEQFENDLAAQLLRFRPGRSIWVEDESPAIGKLTVPRRFWKAIQTAPLFDVQVPIDVRVAALLKEYGSLDREFLVACTERVGKRLGTQQTKQAIAAIREERLEDFIRIVLVYYDKTYRKALDARDGARDTSHDSAPDAARDTPGRIPLVVKDGDAAANAARLLAAAKTIPAPTPAAT